MMLSEYMEIETRCFDCPKRLKTRFHVSDLKISGGYLKDMDMDGWPRGSTNVENLIVPLANGQPRQAGRFGKTSKS